MTERPGLKPLDESTFETVLCVVAHPDDLEYGTAAAVDKWVAAGKTVTYLLATRGEAGIDTMPPARGRPAARAGGAGRRRQGRRSTSWSSSTIRDGVVEYGLPLRRAIAREIRIRRPDLVVTADVRRPVPGGLRQPGRPPRGGPRRRRCESPTPATGGSSPSSSRRGTSRGRSAVLVVGGSRADALRRRLGPLRRGRGLAVGARGLPRGARRPTTRSRPSCSA